MSSCTNKSPVADPETKETKPTTTSSKAQLKTTKKTLVPQDKVNMDLLTWNIQLKDGMVKIKLRPDLAPNHVKRIQALTQQKFYDGLKFHRVINGFMAQTGDPTGTGRSGSSLGEIDAEFSKVPFERGVVGMARAQDPNSANSQFFIMFKAAPSLNNNYTVIGEVLKGMEFVDKIKKGAGPGGGVTDPDTMIKATLSKS